MIHSTSSSSTKTEAAGMDWFRSWHGAPMGNAVITEAGHWLHDNRNEINGPVVPALRRRFGLTPQQAIEAIREANVKRGNTPAGQEQASKPTVAPVDAEPLGTGGAA
jgi:hypothetical protein